MKETRAYPERSEEPLRLGGKVSGLEDGLDGLLGVLSVSDFLESFRRDGSFETLEVESVSGGEEVVVVDRLLQLCVNLRSSSCQLIRQDDTTTHLDERLDL